MAIEDRTRVEPSTTQQDTIELKSSPLVDVSAEGVFVSATSLGDGSSTSSLHDSSMSECSASSVWKSCKSLDYHTGAPLIVASPDSSEQIRDEAEALGRAISRSRRLPGTWYYASNHIMVNRERTSMMVAPVTRLSELDAIAREHSERMAAECRLFHSEPFEIQSSFSRTSRRLGENVARGATIRKIHKAMMEKLSDRNNILDRRYSNMGMATARGSDGMLYLCQVFRG